MLATERAMELLGRITGTTRVLVTRAARTVARYPAHSLAALLVFVLGLSVVLYAGYGTSRVRRVLFFPDPATGKLVGEDHYIPRSAGREQSVRELVQELLVGPAAYDLAPVVPRSVDLRSLTLEDRIVYLDLSADFVIDAFSIPLSLDKAVQAVANNLYFNFPRLRGVYLFIHGQIPVLADVDASRLAYSREMVR